MYQDLVRQREPQSVFSLIRQIFHQVQVLIQRLVGHLPDGLLPRLLLELHRALLRFVLGGRGERAHAVLARPRRLVLHGVDGLQLVLIFLDLGRGDDPRAPLDAPELGRRDDGRARGQRAAAALGLRLAAEEALVDDHLAALVLALRGQPLGALEIARWGAARAPASDGSRARGQPRVS